MRIYLAGPMRGIPNFNAPAFKAAATALREAGHIVFSPAERDELVHGPAALWSPTGKLADAEAHGFDLHVALKADLIWLCDCADAIALLPGWETSRGATAERAVAKALGLMVVELGS